MLLSIYLSIYYYNKRKLLLAFAIYARNALTSFV